jgi:hypothetical protein
LKPEWLGSLLVQENNQEEKACDKRRIIIIIILIIINTGYEEHTMKTKISHLLYMDD